MISMLIFNFFCFKCTGLNRHSRLSFRRQRQVGIRDSTYAVLPGLALTLTFLSLVTLGRVLANVLEGRRGIAEDEPAAAPVQVKP